MNVVIWDAGPSHMHGGLRALRNLKRELRARGIDAYLHTEEYPPDATAIYPEIIPQNWLNAPRAIWWLLNKASFADGTEVWAWESGMGTDQLLTVNIIEEFWFNRHKSRQGVAYWEGKGRIDSTIIPDGATHIHRGNFPDRLQLARFISGLDYLISFDPFTIMNIEAAVSGTPVLIHAPDNEWSREDFERHAWVRHGIAWHPTELQQAKETVWMAAAEYDNKTIEFAARIDTFIASLRTHDPERRPE